MRALPFALLALIVAGCGEEAESPAAKRTPAATETATAAETANPQTEIRALVSEYYETVSSGDPEGTCKTLAPSEQEHFGDDCAKAFTFDAKTRKLVKGNQVGSIKLDGDRAEITVTSSAGTEAPEPLYAIRVDGKWGIARKVAYNRAG